MFVSNPHENKGPVLAGFVGLFMALAIIFTTLRLYVRTFLTKGWGKDDVLLIISLIFYIALCASCFISITYGNGRHILDVNPTQLPIALRLWWLGEVIYTITTLLVRITVAVFLLRLFKQPLHRWIIYGTTFAYTLFSIFFFFLVLFQCKSVSFFWGHSAGLKSSCKGSQIIPSASIAQSVLGFVADWIMGLLPMHVLYGLQMNKRLKVSIASLMSLGLLAGITAMVRIPLVRDLTITDDWLYKNTDVAICSVVEPGLGIIAIAGATFRPLFRAFFSPEHGSLTASPRSSLMRHSRWHKHTRKSGFGQSNTHYTRRLSTNPSSTSLLRPTPKREDTAEVKVNPLLQHPSPRSSLTKIAKMESMSTVEVRGLSLGPNPLLQHPSERFSRFMEEGFADGGEGGSGEEPVKKGGTVVFAPELGRLNTHPFAQTPTRSHPPSPSAFPMPPSSSSSSSSSNHTAPPQSIPTSKYAITPINLISLKNENNTGIHVQHTVQIISDPLDLTPEGFLNTSISSPFTPDRRFSTVSASSYAFEQPQTSHHNAEDEEDGYGIKEYNEIRQMGSLILGRENGDEEKKEWEVVRPGTAQSEVSVCSIGTMETSHTTQTGLSEVDREREVYLSKVRIARSGSFGVLGGREYDVKGGGSGSDGSGGRV